MRNAVIACLALAALSACASDRNSTGAETAKSDYAASFAPEAADLLLVEVRDQDPVRAARLVAPDGSVYEAHAIDTDRIRGSGGGGFYPSVGVGVGGGSNSGVSTGVGIGFPIFGGGGGGAGRTEYRSTARIRVPDLAAYRANWQKYELRVTLGEGAEEHQVVIPAPEPTAP